MTKNGPTVLRNAGTCYTSQRFWPWIARIHSRTLINTVTLYTTTLCQAPTQLKLFSTCWVFSCFRNPLNSDMDYRIFIMRKWSIMFIRTQWVINHNIFDWEKLAIFSCAPDGIQTSVLWTWSLTLYQLSPNRKMPYYIKVWTWAFSQCDARRYCRLPSAIQFEWQLTTLSTTWFFYSKFSEWFFNLKLPYLQEILTFWGQTRWPYCQQVRPLWTHLEKIPGCPSGKQHQGGWKTAHRKREKTRSWLITS